MSKVKDIARAKGGNPHVTTYPPQTCRIYICAYCHKPGQFVKVDDHYFHPDCPKRVIPFRIAREPQ
ncbi:hypothetical protein ES708_13700 [subsurface metagenome]